MRVSRLATVLVIAGAACVTRPGTLDQSLAPGAQWTATIAQENGGTLHGTITFVRTEPVEQARAIFALAGGTPNAVIPWHVHFGVCGNDRMIVGSPANYPPLVLGNNGAINAIAQLPVQLADAQAYVIHLHASPSDIHSVIACAPLVRGEPAAAVAARAP
ncbi:MAG TPA: hypothetical protein VHM30_19570 [Gemmatimonadaceae bacterium]|nr:hypothetical protein [Gemmatimonadaceae bacterium]